MFGTLLCLLLTMTAPGLPAARTTLYDIELLTTEGSQLNGLLLSATDSQLVIFPGRYKEWKKKMPYKTVYYSYHTIEKVRLYKRTGFWRSLFTRPVTIYIGGDRNRFSEVHHRIGDLLKKVV